MFERSAQQHDEQLEHQPTTATTKNCENCSPRKKKKTRRRKMVTVQHQRSAELNLHETEELLTTPMAFPLVIRSATIW